MLSADGSEALRESRNGSLDKAIELGRSVAVALLDRGADRLLRLAGRGVEHG